MVALLQLDQQVKDPERWLRRRLNSGQLTGLRVGRQWRMRDRDIERMLQQFSNDDRVPESPKPAEPPLVESVSIADGMSSRSRKRLRRVQ